MLYDLLLFFDKWLGVVYLLRAGQIFYFSSIFSLTCNNGVFELLLGAGMPLQVFHDNN